MFLNVWPILDDRRGIRHDDIDISLFYMLSVQHATTSIRYISHAYLFDILVHVVDRMHQVDSIGVFVQLSSGQLILAYIKECPQHKQTTSSLGLNASQLQRRTTRGIQIINMTGIYSCDPVGLLQNRFLASSPK